MAVALLRAHWQSSLQSCELAATINQQISNYSRSGLKVVTTCSLRHEKWLRGLGADYVFDYKSSTCAADILRATNGRVAYVLDTIATIDTAQICCDAMGPQGGIYTSLGPVSELPRADIVNKNTVSFTAIGEAFQMGDQSIPANPADYEFASKFTTLAQELVSQGDLKVHPVSLQSGGLEGVLEGLKKLREGSVSGVKLVYTIGGLE